MMTDKTRWGARQSDLGLLSMALKPIRTAHEVAQMLGVSDALVRQIENSALRKIARALKEHDREFGTLKNNIARTRLGRSSAPPQPPLVGRASRRAVNFE